VRFEINLEDASTAGLKVSAKLLRLARTVYGAK
jgi:YfiR/HmsC-like